MEELLQKVIEDGEWKSLRFTVYNYLEEEEHKYGLTFGFRPEQSDAMFAKIDELLSKGTANLKAEWTTRRQKLLDEKIDYTAFLTWFIENYPSSAKEAKGRDADDVFWKQFK